MVQHDFKIKQYMNFSKAIAPEDLLICGVSTSTQHKLKSKKCLVCQKCSFRLSRMQILTLKLQSADKNNTQKWNC